jgi:uncharacterized membrane protein HdeD (DUF308 family)
MSTQNQLIIHRSNMALKGIGVATFGLVALCYPGESINALLLPFGALVTINGAVVIFNNTKYMRGRFRGRSAMFRKGIAELLIGLSAIGSVMMEVAASGALMGLWATLTGIAQATNFYRLRQQMPHWSVVVAAGIFSFLFGLLVAINSVVGMVGLTYEVAAFALLLGGSMFYAYAQLGEIRQYLGNRRPKNYSLKTANA